jgi:hypothetical protein
VVKVYPELLNVAVQPMLPVIVTVPAVVQLPDQPPNVEPETGVAVNVTAVPLLRTVVQVLPQLIVPGLLLTVPLPVPARVTVSVYVVIKLNVAVQVMLPVIVKLTLGLAVLQPAPDHPAKVEPLAGVALRVTAVPPTYASLQSFPHAIPKGELLIVPLPDLATLSVKLAASVVPQISFVYAELPAVLNALTR